MRALALLAALPLAACGGLAADVEIERFCYTTPVSSIPGAPAPLPAGTALGSAIPASLPLPPLLRAKGEVTVRLEEAAVTATSAGADLSGIVRLSLEEQPAAGPRVVLARYQRPASGFPVPMRSITAAGQGVDIVEAVKAGAVNVVIVAEGQAPATAWSAEITLCAYGKSKIDYF